MRQFRKIIHMGNGDFSMIEAEKLKLRLEEALILLCAMQQPDHPKSDEHARDLKETRIRMQNDLNDCINDICVALGAGIRISIDEYHKTNIKINRR